MKTRWIALPVAVLMSVANMRGAATNDLTSLLQQGLFEEEANRNLDAAIASYQSLAAQFDKDRQVAATAVFRLGECYRKLGKTNEAVLQYQRIVKEFSDQATLVTLSRQNLAGLNAVAEVSALTPVSLAAREEQKKLLQRQIELAEQDLADAQKQAAVGVRPQTEVRAAEMNMLRLRQQLAALDANQPELLSLTPDAATVTDEEQLEIRRIQVMTENSPDLINAPDAGGNTPLLRAAAKGQLTVARYLLDHGASPNVRGSSANAPLSEAVANGHKAMVELLLSRGADVNAKSNGRTPLYEAVSHGFTGVIDVLLANKAKVNEPSNGETPIHNSTALKNPALVKLLIAKGADVNARSALGNTPLGQAVSYEANDTVPILIAAGADVNGRDGFGRTPLHLAAQTAQTNAVAALLTAGADVAAKDRDGRTPLHLAVNEPNRIGMSERCRDVVSLLLDHGAPVDALDNHNTAPLVLAVANENVDAVKLLLDHKADPNRTGFGTWTKRDSAPPMRAVDSGRPVLFALATKNVEILKLLLDHGADPEKQTDSEKDLRPLVRAIGLGLAPAVELLLQYKADPNREASADDGHLPLEAASGQGIEFVRLLLEAKADPNAKNRWGDTPFAAAIASGRVDAARLMLEHGADVSVRDKYGNTPLHKAVFNARADSVALLVASNADVNAQNQVGSSPLDIASAGAQSGQANNSLVYPRSGGSQNVNKSSMQAIAATLREHGARTDLPRRDRIEVRRPSANFSEEILWKGTNDWNQFSLLELMGRHYGLLSTSLLREPVQVAGNASSIWRGAALRFPDLKRVVIHRPDANGRTWKSIPVDVAAILQSGDCSRDVWLQWGDVVEIPESDHLVTDVWAGFNAADSATLTKCLSRKFTVRIQGANSEVKLAPEFTVDGPRTSPYESARLVQVSFTVRSVLDSSRLIRFSSDLSHVKVIRRDPGTGKNREWVVDCSDPGNSPDLWLRDGDVIEVPER